MKTITITDHYDPSGIITAYSDPAAEFARWQEFAAENPSDWRGDEFTLADFASHIAGLAPTKAKAFAAFQPSGNGAYATCRLLPGQWEQANQQEWAERGTIDGRPATVYYMFTNAEAAVEDGADMPFDVEHISAVEIDGLVIN